MRGPLRGMLAGLGAWKLGGGCFSTVIIFVLLFWLLGDSTCGGSACGGGARPAILSATNPTAASYRTPINVAN